MSEPVPEAFLAEPRRFFLEWIPQVLAKHEGATAHFGGVRAVAQFHLTGDRGGFWYFEMGSGQIAIAEGQHDKPSFTLTMPVPVWQQLQRGTLATTRAYLRGDVKFKGSWLKLIKVMKLFSG